MTFHIDGTDKSVFAGGVAIGGGNVPVRIAGPCAVESREQIIKIAQIVKSAGAEFLRGGVFKPRTSPYDFQGLGWEGLEYLKEAGNLTGLPIVTEILDQNHIDRLVEQIDLIQIGSRNMHNYALLKAVGETGKPVMLKRGMSATLREWILAAEYLAASGNGDIILCERGIRTFSDYTRNTLDLSAVPIMKKETGLPVVVDPSHGTGLRELVLPMSKAALACGADGIMVEVHNNPEKALSDGPQSLMEEDYKKLVSEMEIFRHNENV
ncbi:MAG TPA: 3-deoxy-7-phosphoheptulonate synthase [Clostridia bacterium]|nr:3-deoxy-7-phosphoheptulonate synthase [Clostridia bacterium]